ncbi:MAG: phosphoribosylglycinamide formyltransferase [Cyanobacteriota bacterium ELA615]
MSFLVSPALENIGPHDHLKLGVMASGNGSNFEAIAQAIADNRLNAEVKMVIYNNPQAKVQSRAQSWKVPSLLLDHRNYPSRESLDQSIVEVFRENKVDWIIMAGWMRIVTEVLLSGYSNRVINVHPSLLPSFKGLHAVDQALAARVKITGCSVHLASLEVDSGPILMQAAVPILNDDTLETLHARIQQQEHRILPAAIALASRLI